MWKQRLGINRGKIGDAWIADNPLNCPLNGIVIDRLADLLSQIDKSSKICQLISEVVKVLAICVSLQRVCSLNVSRTIARKGFIRNFAFHQVTFISQMYHKCYLEEGRKKLFLQTTSHFFKTYFFNTKINWDAPISELNSQFMMVPMTL